MNIEKEFKNLIQSQVQTLDEDSFINKLHLERKKRYAKKIGFMNGVSASAFLAIFGFFGAPGSIPSIFSLKTSLFD